jgi:diaminopimelate decarboxylase
MSTHLSDDALIAAAEQYGTPVYVYHGEKIAGQFHLLQEVFAKADARFFYAAKALTNIHILTFIREMGCNIDCSSLNEVHIALRAGFPPERILYTSNNIHFSEIEGACDAGAHINIDSLSNLEKFGSKYGGSYPVGLRLRPNIMAGGNIKISTGHSASKFGIPVEQVPAILELIQQYQLQVRVLHIHTGSEIKDVEVFVRGIDVLFELLPQFPSVEVIDLGGGFKVPYEPGEKGTDMRALGKAVAERFAEQEKKTGKHLQVWFEPGKFLVAEAGHLVTRVNVIKDNGAVHFAGVDTGLNHLIRPMFYGAYHEIDNISHPQGIRKPYNVVGYICETDTFAEQRMIPEIREGDLLAIRNAGAYCYEMAMTYNSRFRPAEVLYVGGQGKLIRKRETLEDLLKNQLA